MAVIYIVSEFSEIKYLDKVTQPCLKLMNLVFNEDISYSESGLVRLNQVRTDPPPSLVCLSPVINISTGISWLMVRGQRVRTLREAESGVTGEGG